MAFDPNVDAHTLHTAYKGLGTDEDAVIGVLCKRNAVQVEAIKKAYHAHHGKELIAVNHSELSGKFLRVIEGILYAPGEFDAHTLHTAMKGLGTDEKALIETLVGRSNADIWAMCAAYERLYNKSLKEAISSDTSGDFKRCLHHLLEPRDESPLNPELANTDAERLYQAGEGKIGTDENLFIEIFTRRSYPHLYEVFHIYENNHKHHTILKAVESEFSGDIRTILRAIATFVRNPGEFYAIGLYESMKGVGTDDDRLIRLLVGQRHQLGLIKTAFAAKYDKSLYNFVRDDCSGDYRKSLLTLIESH